MLLIPPTAFADIQAPKASFSFSQRAFTSDANPAFAALVVSRKDPHVVTGGMLNLGIALEYGKLDEIFELYNDLSNGFEPSDPDIGAFLVPV
ncbi:hypothetical protein [Thalassotalea sp. PLHSN55]|uniref:hypothetical protein n=1 Tax=Thalassotalea sp. PLHSN55 TaxID=3435888 RepID=UPI003F83AD7C